jgi:molybdopterin-guanine dinucleotide biosynthesis protein A
MIIAVDLPNLTAVELQRLRRVITSPDHGAFAQTPRGPQPLVSVVPRNLRTPLQSALADGQLSLRRLFTGALGDHMRMVEFSDEAPFQNWNAPAASEG